MNKDNTLNDTKLLGQGSYGCIFKPAFKSKNTTNNNNSRTKKISKLLIKSKDKELKHLKKLHEINSEGKYHPKFNPDTNIIDTDNTKDIISKVKDKFTDCKIITSGDNDDKYIINMEFGGNDISKYLSEKSKNATMNLKQIKEFLTDFINLIDGLILFRNNKLSIMDVKDLNVVYNTQIEGPHKMRFIDFGIMLNYGEITKDEIDIILKQTKYLYVYDYYIYPPEILLLIKEVFELLFNFVNNNYIQLPQNSESNINIQKSEFVNELSKIKLNEKELSSTKLGSLFITSIDLFIKLFKKNIKKYNYTKDNFYYNLSKTILSLVDKYSLINILKTNSKYLTQNNNITNKIIDFLPKYDGKDKKTLFTMNSLENIKSEIELLVV